MWTHPATRINVERLRREFGYRVVEPGAGPLASGQSGIGRLAELDDIVDAVVEAVGDAPIRQPDAAARPPIVDRLGASTSRVAGSSSPPAAPPSRSTRSGSSATAAAAGWASRSSRPPSHRGARVTLIAGRLEVAVPPGDRRRARRVDLGHARRRRRGRVPRPADALVMAAAVADFRPTPPAPTKLTRDAGLTIELEPTEDILAEVGARAGSLDPRPVIVGLRGRDGLARPGPREAPPQGRRPPRRQRRRRGRSGFGTDTNRVSILGTDGSRDDLPLLTKREVADRLLDRVARLLDERDDGPGADWADEHGEPHDERPDRVRPPPVGRRHRQALCRRGADRDDHGLRLPHRGARRRGRRPADPRRATRWPR